MKSIKKFALLVLFAVAAMAGTYAQADFISAKEFKDLMKSNKELVIIDASKSKLYKKAHVKGAIHILYEDLNKDKATNPMGMIQDPEFIAKYFGDLGISENDEIVIYDGGTQKYSSRMFFLLKYVGAKNVKMTHKDDKEWAKNRIMLTAAAPKKRTAVTFTPSVQEEMLVPIEYLVANKDNENIVLVDTRSAAEFSGEKKVIDGVFGHIPGSIHIDYEEFEVAGGAFKNKAQLEELATKYALTKDKEVIFFCKTGVKGAVAYNAFKYIFEHPNVKLYDGGCAEYSSKYELVK